MGRSEGRTFWNVDDDPSFQEGHCHCLEQHQGLPTSPFSDQDSSYALFLAYRRFFHIFHLPSQVHRLLSNEHSRPSEQRPRLCDFESFDGTQLIHHRTRYSQYLTTQALIGEQFCRDISHALHFKCIGIAQYDSLSESFPFANGWLSTSV